MNKMNAYSVLDPTLKAILDVINPLREDWVVRAKIIEDLNDVVKSVESLRGATVEPFGSFVSNLFTRWGDLDISIMVSNGSCVSSAGRKCKQNLLDDLLRALRLRGGLRRLQCIKNARVPILKFENGQRISCDISIDNLEGQMKSAFLFWINEIDGRFRDMVLLVKEWAKAHNINNPKTGTLNSYSLSLLIIFHFQTCVPAILPPLKDIYPRNVVDDLTGARSDAERRIKEICAANINRYKANRSRAVNQSSLSELFISFFAKFSDISIKAKELGICLFSGQWETISSNTRWLPKTYALFIEDPFEQPANTARAVSAGNLEKISKVFQATYLGLVYPNQNQMSVLATLVRPQIAEVIAGTSVRNYSNPMTHHQHVSRTVYTVPPVQRQFQNMKLERHTNNPAVRRKEAPNPNTQRKESLPKNSTSQRQESRPNNLTKQRPVQQNRSQSQQMWRPKSDG